MKKRKETPRMTKYVVQAVTDLKDLNGSTTRKIMDQVHTAINIANTKPKPRNIVMQVKKALKHAVDTGVLRHRAGKYRLALELNDPRKANKKDKGYRQHRRLKKNAKRSRKGRHRPRRKLIRQRRSVSRSSVSGLASPSSISSFGSTEDRYSTDSEKRSRSVRRRRRSVVKKRVQISRQAKSRGRRRMRRPRRQTPMPTADSKLEDVEPQSDQVENSENAFVPQNGQLDQPEIGHQEQLENALVDSICQQIEDGDSLILESLPCDPIEPLRIEEIPPECDNPECLCNLKQEPCEENNYEDMNSDINMDIADDNMNES